MIVEYLKDLQDYPNFSDDDFYSNSPLSIDEIKNLESQYNNGENFPKALRELLFLAGAGCYVLDFGVWDNLQEVQESVIERIQEFKESISRPFFVIDIYDFSSQFFYVHFDEGEDPPVYRGLIDRSLSAGEFEITVIRESLSHFISYLLQKSKEQFESEEESEIYWSFLNKYGISFHAKTILDESYFEMLSNSFLLNQFFKGHQNIEIIDETIYDLNLLLKGEIDTLEYSVESLTTVVANELISKIYELPDLSLPLAPFELPTVDLELIFKYWKEFIIQRSHSK